MAGFLIGDAEQEAMTGLPYMLIALYLYLRKHMDYSSGIVGRSRGISYQSLSEALYIEPHSGIKGGSPHRSAIRRALESLERAGLLKRSNNQKLLIFKLPLAQVGLITPKKPDTNPTQETDTPRASPVKAKSNKADIPKTAEPDIHQVSGNTVNLTTTTEILNIVASSSIHPLIFSNRIHEDSKPALERQLKGFAPEVQQELLDELAGYIERGKVQVTHEALMHGLCKSAKQGIFNPAYASKIRAKRLTPEKPAIPVLPPKATPDQKAKGREKMNDVMRVLKGGKA